MRTRAVNAERLLAASGRLGDAVVDPTLWPQVMDGICAAAGATGAALLQTDIRTPDIPRTASVDHCFKHYFASGWQTRDARAERSVPLLLSGHPVVTDQDIVTPEEMQRLDFYNECAFPFGLPWFAGIGLRAGTSLWAMVIQRNAQQGPFEPEETRILALLAPRLSETATLSKAVGYAALSGVGDALQFVGHPALAIDRLGSVLDCNAAIQRIFDDEVFVCNRRLTVRDPQANLALEALADRFRTTSDAAPLPMPPIIVRRSARRPLMIRVLPVSGPARSPFLGARALLVLSDLDRPSEPPSNVLSHAFGLSPAEARVAALIAGGASIAQAAERLGLSISTIRNHLKAVFAKTDTGRQSELVALLSRL